MKSIKDNQQNLQQVKHIVLYIVKSMRIIQRKHINKIVKPNQPIRVILSYF